MLASEARKLANKVEFFGKDIRRMNLDEKAYHAITTRTFFHKLSDITEFHGFIRRLEEGAFRIVAYEEGGGYITPAWCYLFKMHSMKLTKKQLMNLLKHGMSHIRALGCLYVRYVVAPRSFPEYLSAALKSPPEDAVDIGRRRKVSMREFIRLLLTESKPFGAPFPRLSPKDMECYMSWFEDMGLNADPHDRSDSHSHGRSDSRDRSDRYDRYEGRGEERRERSGHREWSREGSRDEHTHRHRYSDDEHRDDFRRSRRRDDDDRWSRDSDQKRRKYA
eukprot:TRINITY_DN400_c0_g3_i1.p1 TRINITY_DN400_c0_g3~~TRINITY_DN400_c0_g3_i1.p1  ORF type:complete len:277 (-),score=49.03 TRINITY_DN400_c0_g3_i1:40-870(-)